MLSSLLGRDDEEAARGRGALPLGGVFGVRGPRGGGGGGEGDSPYNRSGRREARDAWAHRALLASLAACVVGGLLLWRTSGDARLSTPGFLDRPDSCGLRPSAPGAGRRLLGATYTFTFGTPADGGRAAGDRSAVVGGGAAAAALWAGAWPRQGGGPFPLPSLRQVDISPGAALFWILVALITPLCLGGWWLDVLCRHAPALVTACALAYICSLVVAAYIASSFGLSGLSLSLLAVALPLALFWYCYRHHAATCGRLISAAAAGLANTPGLVRLTIKLCVYAALASIPFFALAAAATSARVPVPNPALARALQIGAPTVAVLPDRCKLGGERVPCCVAGAGGVSGAYSSLLAFAMVWVWAAICSARKFVVAGVVAEWVTTPAGADAPKDSLHANAKNASGPQAGTLALSAALAAAVLCLRSRLGGLWWVAALLPADLADRSGVRAARAFGAVAGLALDAVDLVNRFALVWAAVTGLRLADAAREVAGLLRHSPLEALGVFLVPGMVVWTASSAAALAWGAAVFAAVTLTGGGGPGAAAAGLAAGAFGAASALVVLMVLGGLLLDATDAVFLCYAWGRAAGGGDGGGVVGGKLQWVDGFDEGPALWQPPGRGGGDGFAYQPAPSPPPYEKA